MSGDGEGVVDRSDLAFSFLFFFFDAFEAFTSTYWECDCILFSALILLIGDKKVFMLFTISACGLHFGSDALVFVSKSRRRCNDV